MSFQRLDLTNLHIPSFVYDEYPQFVELLQKYYEWLSLPGNSGSMTELQSYRDIEKTPELFVGHFLDQFFYGFDANTQTEADKRTIITNAIEYFKSKGTEESLKYLFRVIFNQEVDVFYPRDLMLELSESGWKQDNYIKVALTSENDIFFDLVINRQVMGEVSNVAVFVSNAIKFNVASNWYATLFIDDTNQHFNNRENIKLTYKDGNQDVVIKRQLSDMVTDSKVISQGQYYIPGEPIPFSNSGSGQDATASVGEVSRGKIEAVEIADGGEGYSLGNKVITVSSITPSGISQGQDAEISIKAVQNNSIKAYSLVSSGQNFKLGTEFTLSYTGTGAKLTPIVSPTGTISYIKIESGGSGYKTPVLSITGSGVNAVATPIVNVLNQSINIISGGTGYSATPTINIAAPPLGGTQAVATATINAKLTGFTSLVGGSGYTTPPLVTIDPPPLGGTQATAQAVVSGGSVIQIQIINTGAGYTSVPGVSITGGGGSSASVTATISGYISSVNLSNVGKGYTSIPAVTVSGTAELEMFALSGVIVGATVTNAGSGYKQATTKVDVTDSVANIGVDAKGKVSQLASSAIGSIGTIQLSDSGTNFAPTEILSIIPTPVVNKTLQGEVTSLTSYVNSVVLTNTGTGYGSVPTVTISAPTTGVRATAEAVLMSDGISKINFTAGSGYTSEPTIEITGDGTGAKAKVNLGNGIVKTGSLKLTNRGLGYTSAPSVVFSSKNAPTVHATAHTTITGLVSNLTLVTKGEYASAPTITFTGTGIDAAATPVMSGYVKTITVDTAGSGYEVAPKVTIPGSTTGDNATAIVTIKGPINSTVTVTNTGTGYITSPDVIIPAPTPSVGTTAVLSSNVTGSIEFIKVRYGGQYSVAPTTASVSAGGGSGAVISPITAQIGSNRWTIVGFTISNAGSGFNSIPTISIDNGTAILGPDPEFIVSITGTISSVSITSGGTNYTNVPRILAAAPSDLTGTEATIASTILANAVNTVTPSSGSKYKLSTQYCKLTQSSNVVTILNPYTTIDVGSVVTGVGVPANTVVTKYSTTTVELNNAINSSIGSNPLRVLTFISKPELTVTAPGQAFATVVLGAGGKINSFTIKNSGSYYNSIPTVSLTADSGSSATFKTTFTGSIQDFYIKNEGSGYNEATSYIRITSRDGNGSGASAKPVFKYGKLIGVNIISRGSGYTASPIVELISGELLPPQPIVGIGPVWDIRRRLVNQRNSEVPSVITYPGSGASIGVIVKYTLTGVEITNQGSGYVNPKLTFSEPPTQQAQIEPIIKSGKVVGVKTIKPGIGYSTASVITISYPVRSHAIIIPIIREDIIVGYNIKSSGDGYNELADLYVSVPNPTIFSDKKSLVDITSSTFGIGSVTVNYVGAGYTETPQVLIDGTAKATCKLNAVIDSVSLVTSGSGYTSAPTPVLSQVLGSAALSTTVKYKITNVLLTNKGSGYDSAPTVNIIGGSPTSGQDGYITSTISKYINTIVLDTPGSGYTDTPKVTLVGGSPSILGLATCVGEFNVTSISILNQGTGYSSASAVLTGGGFSVAATATPVVTSSVKEIKITNPGSGYTTVPTVSISGGSPSVAATADAKLRSVGEISTLNLTRTGINLKVNDTFSITPSIDPGTGAKAHVVHLDGSSINTIELDSTGVDYRVGDILELNQEQPVGKGLTFEVNSVSTGSVTSLNILSGGSGYLQNDLVDLNPIKSNAAGLKLKVTSVSSGAPTGLEILSNGTYYNINDRLNLVSANPGINATITVTTIDDSLQIESFSITNAGSGYRVGDLVEIFNDVEYSKARFKVLEVSSTGSIVAIEKYDSFGTFSADITYDLVGINEGLESGAGAVIKIKKVNGSGTILNTYVDVTTKPGWIIVNSGLYYNVGDKLVLESMIGGLAVFTVTNTDAKGSITGLTLTSGGVGYVLGNYSTRKDSSGKGGLITVTGIDSGIAEFDLINVGSGYSASAAEVTVTGNAKIRIRKIRNGYVTAGTIVSGGTNYKVNDIINVVSDTAYHNTYLTLKVKTVSSGKVTSFTILDGGDSYVAGTIYNSISTGIGFTFKVNTIANGTLYDVEIVSRGSGYKANDTLTVTGGTGTLKVIRTVDSGKVLTIGSFTGGTGYAVGDVITTSQYISGTGAKVKVLAVNEQGSVDNVTTTGNIANTSNIISNVNISNIDITDLCVGMRVTGAGIPADTFIQSVLELVTGEVAVQVSNACTATTVGLAITLSSIDIISGGSGYSQYNTLYTTYPMLGAGARIRVGSVSGSGAITGFTYLQEAVGSGYTQNDKLTLVNVNEGSGGTLKVTSVYLPTDANVLNNVSQIGGVKTFEITNGGSEYSIGDIIEFTSVPGGINGQIRVDSIRNGNIKSVEITNPGIGYNIQPVLTPSVGTGANLIALGSDIGKLKSIKILNPGFNYISVPKLNLTELGDGNATAELYNGTIFNESGSFTDEKSQVSQRSYVTDGDFYQKYSYAIKTSKSINEYGSLIKQLFHPAGYKLFGQLLIEEVVASGLGSNDINVLASRGTVNTFTLSGGTGFTVGDIVTFYNNSSIHNQSYFTVRVNAVGAGGSLTNTVTVLNYGSEYVPGLYSSVATTGVNGMLSVLTITSQGKKYIDVTSFIEMSTFNVKKYIDTSIIAYTLPNANNIETLKYVDNNVINDSYQILQLTSVSGSFIPYETITESVTGLTGRVLDFNFATKTLNVIFNTKPFTISGGTVLTGTTSLVVATGTTQSALAVIMGNTQGDIETDAKQMSNTPVSIVQNQKVVDWVSDSSVNTENFAKKTIYVLDATIIANSQFDGFNIDLTTKVMITKNIQGLKKGMLVSGTGIQAGTSINYISEDYMLISQAPTQVLNNVTLTFKAP